MVSKTKTNQKNTKNKRFRVSKELLQNSSYITFVHRFKHLWNRRSPQESIMEKSDTPKLGCPCSWLAISYTWTDEHVHDVTKKICLFRVQKVYTNLQAYMHSLRKVLSYPKSCWEEPRVGVFLIQVGGRYVDHLKKKLKKKLILFRMARQGMQVRALCIFPSITSVIYLRWKCSFRPKTLNLFPGQSNIPKSSHFFPAYIWVYIYIYQLYIYQLNNIYVWTNLQTTMVFAGLIFSNQKFSSKHGRILPTIFRSNSSNFSSNLHYGVTNFSAM